MSKREVTCEERIRYFTRIYRGGSQLPFRYWRWATDENNNFIQWV